ncbi:low affinity immunoglobulin epsilon Fc receptor-like [Patiria miniata]|uniref:C-type lectin domain-containing protein n=1 Tax=Patiria miniata TaxID=46514 RepID=A0A913Z4M4_PATMI|nr:low affinity immunoglobulin epsilon Fc receptor-like [Patiria miniata]
MSIFSLANVLILMTVGGYHTLLAVCPPGWLAWQDACYILLPDKMDWWQAKRVCDRPGSSLIVPDSQKEQDFIWREFGSANGLDMWIGCKDIYNNGSLSCFGVNGDPVYKNWKNKYFEQNNVNHRCVRMAKNGNWRDTSCSYLKYAACEMRVSRRSYCLQADADGRFTHQCLLNHEIKNLTAAGVIGCSQACWAEPRCRSFNLWQKGDDKKVCQLNNATRSEAEVTDLKYVKNCNLFEL